MASMMLPEWTKMTPSLDCPSTRMFTMERFNFAAIYFIFGGSGYKYQQRTCHQRVPNKEIISTFYPVK